jgi:hypothetical protein
MQERLRDKGIVVLAVSIDGDEVAGLWIGTARMSHSI